MKYMHQTTDPWNERQFVWVDNFPLVYTTQGDKFLIRMPGGAAMNLGQLKSKGYTVQKPDQPRREIAPVAK
jgi:hypothetical protein